MLNKSKYQRSSFIIIRNVVVIIIWGLSMLFWMTSRILRSVESSLIIQGLFRSTIDISIIATVISTIVIIPTEAATTVEAIVSTIIVVSISIHPTVSATKAASFFTDGAIHVSIRESAVLKAGLISLVESVSSAEVVSISVEAARPVIEGLALKLPSFKSVASSPAVKPRASTIKCTGPSPIKSINSSIGTLASAVWTPLA